MDATAIPSNRGGVGRYLEYLLPALDAVGARMTVVVKSPDAEWVRLGAPHAEVVVSEAAGRSRARRLAWEQWGLPRLARRHRADVVFSPHYTMPVLSPVPVVVTLHDATFFSHPELHGRLKRAFFRLWTRYSLRRAAATIVPSAATRDEEVAHAHARPESVTVAYHGVDTARFHPPTAEQVADARRLLGGASEWIAFLGTLEPRKNVANLVRAFDLLAAHRPGLALALAGGRGWDTELDGVIAAASARARIHSLGFVDDGVLPGLLGGAVAVAYPSLGEGFGLPVLEAMACGAPVVTTRLLALPEVGGEAALYSEPDAGSLAAALATLVDDPAERARRSALGVTQAARFSWADSARTHLAVFTAAAVRPRRAA